MSVLFLWRDFMELVYLAPLAGVISLLFAAYLLKNVLLQNPGNEKMQYLSNIIFEGAMTFLNRQYKTLLPFTLIIALILLMVSNYKVSISFLVGATCSALAGYIGMTATTKANSRTTQAATAGISPALSVSFKAGSIMGMSVVGLGLLGVSTLYIIFQDTVIINSFAFGASAIAFFARVGGGIFTKAADVGADLVGKVEAGIPEDDPRNPAVIADNVGDNVGDTAGMGADLFESYGATTIAAMIIGNSFYGINGVIYPLLLGAVGIIATLISFFFVKIDKEDNVQKALNFGIWGTNIITALVAYLLAIYMFGSKGQDIFLAIAAGLFVNFTIGLVTEHYTSSANKPTQKIAQASQMGVATNILTGVSTGLKSTVIPIIVFLVATWWSFNHAGIYGIAMAAMGMLCTAGMVVAIDSFGPVGLSGGAPVAPPRLPHQRLHRSAGRPAGPARGAARRAPAGDRLQHARLQRCGAAAGGARGSARPAGGTGVGLCHGRDRAGGPGRRRSRPDPQPQRCAGTVRHRGPADPCRRVNRTAPPALPLACNAFMKIRTCWCWPSRLVCCACQGADPTSKTA